MELRHLRYFVIVAEELNITRAAARLKVSQPPLSRQIRDLERAIGAPLFHRQKNRLTLTAAGRYFFDEAKKILSHTERATRIAKATALGRAGSAKIGFLSPLGGMFLPQVVKSFRRKFPLVDLDLFEMVPRVQIDALLNREIDIAFVAKEEVESVNELAFTTIAEVSLQLALPSDHRLAKSNRVKLSDLSRESFVILTRSSAPATHDFLIRALRSGGVEANVAKESDHAQTILDFVAAGIGVALLPEIFQRYQAQVVWRSIAPQPPKIQLCMVWHAGNDSVPLRALRQLILEHVKRP